MPLWHGMEIKLEILMFMHDFLLQTEQVSQVSSVSIQLPLANKLTPVAGLQNGNAFVAWQGDYDIYGRLFAANGTALPNGEFRINTNTTIFPGSPSVASLTNGNVFVAWVGAQAGDYDIYGRIFSTN